MLSTQPYILQEPFTSESIHSRMAAVTRAILTRVSLDIKGWEVKNWEVKNWQVKVYSSNQTFALLHTDDE